MVLHLLAGADKWCVCLPGSRALTIFNHTDHMPGESEKYV